LGVAPPLSPASAANFHHFAYLKVGVLMPCHEDAV
jgi:hypothetical protein